MLQDQVSIKIVPNATLYTVTLQILRFDGLVIVDNLLPLLIALLYL